MNRTNDQKITTSTIATDIDGLVQILGCGKETARSIAQMAGARVSTNSRRTIYSLDKIREYVAKNSY